MLISHVLGTDPRVIHTVEPAATIADTVDILAEFGIGAVIVSGDGRAVDGIVSERDIVRYLQHEQEHTLRIPVEDLMTRTVMTCTRESDVDDVARTMLDLRFRHMPVVNQDDELVAMISLGDLMEARLNAKQTQDSA